MKPCVSILLLALATPLCLAQAVTNSQNTQSQILGQPPLTAGQPLDLERQPVKDMWCPVDLISAKIDTPARYLPVTTPQGYSGSLDLTFRNAANKKIKSAALKVQVKAKKSIYDLDAYTLTTHLEISGIDVASDQLSRRLRLPVPAFGVAQVILESVTYADGSSWSRKSGSGCRLDGQALARVAH
jgi:hypothetical protein